MQQVVGYVRKLSRKDALRKRTRGRCGYCGLRLEREDTTRDHIVPKSKHGRTVTENLMCCCRTCNQRKADMDLEEFRELYFAGDRFWFEILEGRAA